MKMVEMNWRPGEKQLRQFGLIGMAFLPLVAWWWGASPAVLAGVGGIALVLGVLGLVQPGLLRYPFVGLCLVTLPIGMVMGELVLLLSYYLVFVPFALVFRLIGRDSLQRSLQPQQASYWQPRVAVTDKSRYFQQW